MGRLTGASLGLVLPTPGVATGRLGAVGLLDLAERAERDGWGSLWAGDSLLAKPRLEAVTALAAVAARTRRVRLGTACLSSAPLRNPVLLAAQWFTLDALSGGRATLVVCPGPRPSGGVTREYEVSGVASSERLARYEELIAILRATSQAESVSHAGRFWSFEDVTVSPRPVQARPPILLAASPDLADERAVRSALGRVGRLGDGWMVTGYRPAELRAGVARIRELAAAEGRQLPGDFEVVVYHNLNVHDDAAVAFERARAFFAATYGRPPADDYLDRRLAAGPPERCAGQVAALFEAGATRVVLRLADADHEDQYERATAALLAPRGGRA